MATCQCPKALYPSYRSAVRRLLLSLKHGEMSLRIYRCPAGRGWHLTKQRKRARKVS